MIAFKTIYGMEFVFLLKHYSCRKHHFILNVKFSIIPINPKKQVQYNLKLSHIYIFMVKNAVLCIIYLY